MSEFDSEPRAQRLCPPLRRRAAGAGRDIIEEDINDMKKKGTGYSTVVDEWFALLDFLCVAGTTRTHIPETGPERTN